MNGRGEQKRLQAGAGFFLLCLLARPVFAQSIGGITGVNPPAGSGSTTAGGPNLDNLYPRAAGGTWFVDGVNGSDSNSCKSMLSACATIGHALSKATDGAGDVIWVAPANYAENVTVSKSNVALLATTYKSPTLAIPGIIPATGAPLTITGTGEGTVVEGFYLGSSDTSPSVLIDGTTFTGARPDNVTCGACVTLRYDAVDSVASENHDCIKILGGANAYGGVSIDSSIIADCTNGIELVADNGNVVYDIAVSNTSFINNSVRDITATGLNGNTRIWGGGYIYGNHFDDADKTNYIDISANSGGGGILFADEVFNVSKPLTLSQVKIPAGGGALLRSFPSGEIGLSAGVQSKPFTSSAITTSPATAFTASGNLACTDIILETGATGLAGGTNFDITTDNANGLATLCRETVANLGANKTIKCSAASVTALAPFTLEDTKHLKIDCSGSACTGAGTISILPVCTRLSLYATAG